MKQIKVAAKKLLLLMRFLLVKIRALFTVNHGSDPNAVLLDLTGLRINRRIVQVALQLVNAGYSVWYRSTVSIYVETWFSGFDDYQQMFFDHVRYAHPFRSYAVVFCAKDNSRRYAKRIVFDQNIEKFYERQEEEFFFPILFHPWGMLRNTETLVPQGDPESKIGMLFIGSNADSYQNYADVIHKTYGLKTRNEVIGYLCTRFSDQVFRPENEEQLYSALDDPAVSLMHKLVIIDRFRLDGEKYRNIMQISAFHFWTCGYIQPYCHNQIESMVFGAIPIYPRRIRYPGLNTDNAYAYDSFEELGAIVEKLLREDINSRPIIEKRNAVKQLYADRFGNCAFRRKLDRFIGSDKAEETYYICKTIYK